MNYSRLYIAVLFILASSIVNAQSKVLAFDFEKKISVKDWWVDNKEIHFSQCTRNECNQLPGSDKCLRLQWDHVPADRSFTWMTDIKVDTFGSEGMQNTWNNFKENTWLSFKVNTSDADSVYFQFIIFTKDEKDKWGSQEVIGFKNVSWKTLKVKISSLHWTNW